MNSQNFVAGEDVSGTLDRIAAGGMQHGAVRDREIVAQPGIGFFGGGGRQSPKDTLAEGLDEGWHPALVAAVSRA